MNRRKVSEIVKFNVEKNIQNKGFIVLNIIMCIAVIIGVNFKNINKALEANDINLFDEEIKIEVWDKTGLVNNLVEEEFKENKSVEIKYVTENNYTKENIEDDLIIVEYEINNNNKLLTKITSKEAVDGAVYNKITNVSKKIRTQMLSNTFGIEVSELEGLSGEPEVERIMLGVDAENSDTKEIIKTVSIVVVYMILIFVLSRIANEIANEKISKSIEYVLTSVDEKEYLLAKVLGITLTIVIQLVYSFIYYILANGINLMINISEVTNNRGSYI